MITLIILFNNANTCKYYQVIMVITYVNNKSSSFHNLGVGYTIQLAMKVSSICVYQGLYNTNLD
jgi:hypothetical protein